MSDASKLAPDRGDGRKLHYGTGRQPWDDFLEQGWMECFAAASILKYLRRDKAPEHSVESARVYYKQLHKMVEEQKKDKYKIAKLVLGQLDALLNDEEKAILNGKE